MALGMSRVSMQVNIWRQNTILDMKLANLGIINRCQVCFINRCHVGFVGYKFDAVQLVTKMNIFPLILGSYCR